ncbi:D-amino acid dehydrogenase [Devosia sp. A449]
MRQIAVIGAGITGTTTAYALAQQGFSVTVFDRHRYPAMETSFANGGQLSASNAEVWNSWSTILHGMQWLLRPDAPLSFNPKPSWHKYSWMAEFLGNIGNYQANTVATTKLAITARQRLLAVAAAEDIAFDLETRGILHIYRDKPAFDHASAVNALLNKGGLERRAVTPAEIRQIEPAVTGSYHGGFFTPSDATGDIHKFTRELAARCQKLGVRFEQDADVQGLNHGNGRPSVTFMPEASSQSGTITTETRNFDGIVLCAGIASRRLAAMVGDRVNIYPVKGYSITVMLEDAASQAAAPWVSLLDDAAKIVTSRLGPDRFRVAGTAEFNGENRDIRHDRVRPLVDWTRQLFPEVNTDRVVPWAGLRPMMPNMMPKVGRGKSPGIFYNTGHGHLGWTLSMATADLVTGAVSSQIAA